MSDPKTYPSLTYRPALDGIRAFAVLAVLAYHLGLPLARGGYLGVDVFFVLSGYLITSLLLLEHDARGRIDLVRFWIRRARRLLPALLLVLLAVALWVNGTAAPFELPQRRQDLFWALFYGSNWHLISSAQDYFAGVAGASMLRHTWSLAIEEQFYLLWPLIVFGALRLARGRERAVALVCGVGIAASVVAMSLLSSSGDPSRAYYGTDARIHQLLVGALLAVAMVRVPSFRESRPGGTAVAAVSGLVLLVAFATLGDTTTAYYEGLSLVIALAAAMLIWGLEVAPHGAPGRVLSLAPCRWIGTISYGLYLWHWPVVVAVTAPAAAFAWLPGSVGLSVTRVAITFAVATLSFYLVERPIREGSVPLIRHSTPRFGFAVAGLILVVGTTIAFLTASGGELEAQTLGGAADLEGHACTLVVCVRHQATDPDALVVAVIGDSIARSLDLGLVEAAERDDWTYLVASGGGCRVTHLLTVSDAEGDYEACYESTPEVLDELVARWDPDVIVVVQRLELADFAGASGAVVEAGSRDWAVAERRELRGLAETLTGRGARLVFVAIQPYVLPNGCLREDSFDDPACTIPASEDRLGVRFNALLEGVVADAPSRVFLVSVNEHLCPGGLCSPLTAGSLMRYDGHHFSATGARWIVPLLFEEMASVGALIEPSPSL